MNPRVSDRDLELLSAYIDDQLSQPEKGRLERRLQAEPALRETLSGLRGTVRAMRALPQVKVPRNFMLDPAKHGALRPARTFGPLYGLLRFGTALATVLFVVAVAGDFLARSGAQSLALPAQAPAPAEQARSAADTPLATAAAEQALAPTPTTDLLAQAAPAEGEGPAEESAVGEADASDNAPTPATGFFLEGGGRGGGGGGGGGGGEGEPGTGIGGGGGGPEGTDAPPALAAAPPTMDVAAESTVEAAVAAADIAATETPAPPAGPTQTLKSAATETEPAPQVAEAQPAAPAESGAAQQEAVTAARPPFNWLRAAQVGFGALAVVLGLAALWYRARA